MEAISHISTEQATQVLQKHGLSINKIRALCTNSVFPNAIKEKGKWMIPISEVVQYNSYLQKNQQNMITKANYDPNLLMSESGAGLGFVNILFAVSLAVAGLIFGKITTNSWLVLYLFLVVFSSFYSSIFYANVSGSISRLGLLSDVVRPMKYGNALSEYFGVYSIVLAFPLLVWQLSTGNTFITYIALVVDVAGFFFYKISGYDMLARVIPNKVIRHIINMVIYLMIFLQIWLEINGSFRQQTILTAVMVVMLFCFTFIHISKEEKPSKEISRS